MSSEAPSLRVEHELFMRSFFASRPPNRVIRQFSSTLSDAFFQSGETIYREGDTPQQIFFIVEGTVKLTREGEEDWIYGSESVVGILDANLNRPYSRTATVTEDAHVLVIELEDYYDIMEDNFEFFRTVIIDVFGMVQRLSSRLPKDEVFPPLREHGQQPWLSVRRLNEVQRLMVIRAAEFAQGAPVQPLVGLAQAAVERRVSRDKVFLRKGDPLTHLWVVAEGLFEISSPSSAVEAAFGSGQVLLGGASIAFPDARYDVVARRQSLVVGIPFEALWDMMEDHFRLARRLFAWVAHEHERVRGRLTQLQGATKDLSKSMRDP